jgi:hypothetical protein
MGHMNKKHNIRLFSLTAELNGLEAVKKKTKRQERRIARIRNVELPKAQRIKARNQ